jgi:hypothetical protein
MVLQKNRSLEEVPNSRRIEAELVKVSTAAQATNFRQLSCWPESPQAHRSTMGNR